ncbi:MAG: hypothetical protein FJZ16_07215 [Candidatus Omnitrophica bacterium]|nr:hypothetical protein [Candidatus Omnitrophota bacterium]
MRPAWYADKRDLVKWSVLYHLADIYGCKRILQIAFFRDSKFGKVNVGGEDKEIPPEVLKHFRELRNICNMTSRLKIEFFDKKFKDRNSYWESVKSKLAEYSHEKLIVFLDPDTGLEPEIARPSLKHVLRLDVKKIWEGEALKSGDLLVFYQHSFRDKEWVEKTQKALKKATQASFKIARGEGPAIAKDVVFFYLQKG